MLKQASSQHGYFLFFYVFLGCVFLSACDNETVSIQDTPSSTTNKIVNLTTSPIQTASNGIDAKVQQPKLENKSYLFDVNTHSIEELEALLIRAEEVSETHPADFEELDIVMVIHGPDIDWFKEENSAQNKDLVELAARLDAYDIIDMKVCEYTMNSRGVSRDDLPDFIESVPFAPTVIENLLQQGHINL